ncbi:MAG: AAC(3) family N-acetyltransferase [Lentisphaeria bacterium]|nr:AAC(3) family N-acetyltransferase [Lentisphaeria bacterium]
MFLDKFKKTMHALCGDINGKTLFVSSDVSTLLSDSLEFGVMIDLNEIIDLLYKLVGEQGNLIFPTYNWDFCKGITFDYYKTKSRTGALPRIVLKRKDFIRTQHPIYSFAVKGKDADFLASLDYRDAFGADSIFAWFAKVKAQNLFINVPYQHSATFVHHIEEKNKVNYRFIKNFTADYIDKNGLLSNKTYSMFVRYLDREIITTVDPMHEVFLDKGIVKETKFINTKLRLLDMQKAYMVVEENIVLHNCDRLVIIN